MSESSIKPELLDLRESLFQQVIEEPRQEERAKLVGKIQALEKAIATIAPAPDTSKYGRHKRAREAIIEYLASVNHAVPAEDLVTELVTNGFRRGKKTAATDVRKAIGWHLVRNEVIKESNGLVGLLDWPEERFK